ncbi:D-alanyl-D-alanine carboxypeptidase / D-alanyl-D-alanine-endopeptidase (penicillin-binding protein 4) [Lentibacillus halodurans]|uniref:D-alanyl-D-alanine carboxypeptidase / D-alanyl-D-alanine-endopeptidase (Penicillin-binding protein 4) n=1 Tax=Lentibacillus halodurans TaxID=237679 RepID=A0A1I1A103_9BACI|nr:D-alanyl-D-alanine carboxypeptidase/D-alanyl-D-alanine-endopeptidase [Lentibacillus halodurans]SFB30248.1 D-alanyl-D-alanine carboxypeptidase / D-alanyl-D-alanine-endopeptidase (penicillin-binding protein 4) [Lentibacillus halodurans]
MIVKDYGKRLFLFFLLAMVVVMPFAKQDQSFVSASGETAEIMEESGNLTDKLDEILSHDSLKGTSVSVSVRETESGEILYERNGDLRLHPASNMKLLSGAAAMETLGTDYRFTTEVLTDGDVRGQVLHGNLYLKGNGDPTLMKEDLDQFAANLKEKGVQKIKGDLIGDDSRYDDVRLSQDLNWSDEPFYTGAQVSALTLSPNEDYDAGTVIVEAYPADEAGKEADITVTPATDYVTVMNNTETVAAGESKDISIERQHGTNDIVVEGTIPVDGTRSRSWVSVWEPTGYALDVFKKSLEENGLKLIGNSDVKTGLAPDDATVLTSRESIPLEELFIPFMKLSNNGHGEILTKEMGKVVNGEGSWDEGLDVIEDVITDAGMDSDTIVLRDGSGMSHKNMIPANELSGFLTAIKDESWFPAFEKSLPVAGVAERFVGGTLRYRMTEPPAQGNVVAKTGSLTGVSTLSGYVTSQDGEELVFSIMFNNYLGNSNTELEDSIATTLAAYEF